MNSIEDWLNQPGGLADRLRAIRTQAGLSGKDLAGATGWQASKVSRLENGKQLATPEDLDAWVAACGADRAMGQELRRSLVEVQNNHRDFKRRMRHGQVAVQASYNELVQGARLIRHFETVYVPGLLQTAEYARRILTEMVGLHHLDVVDVDAAVATRMQRQQMLYNTTKQFEFLLAEPVLRWIICPVNILRGQLDRLQTVIGMSNIRFGVLPMGVELATAPQNSFQMYDNIAIAETFIGETTHRGDEATAYGRALDRLWDEAITGEAARRVIVQAASALPT